ncbi:unnamed protein product [marine sediment metagenome]|uniref:C1q domain-containing protein n=1 Tax=marine sediment metagenome TaxID=412755 RepID=X0ZMG2_9ZZZZ
MAKSGKIISILALIIGVSGVSVGGYALIQINLMGQEQVPEYVLPTARVFLSFTYDLSSGVTVKFDFSDKSFDSHDAFNLISDEYIIPETGYYQVFAKYDIDAIDQDFFVIEIWRNNNMNRSCTYTPAQSTNYFSVSIADIILAEQGDAISIWAYIYNDPSANRTLFAGEQHTYFSIVKIN